MKKIYLFSTFFSSYIFTLYTQKKGYATAKVLYNSMAVEVIVPHVKNRFLDNNLYYNLYITIFWKQFLVKIFSFLILKL